MQVQLDELLTSELLASHRQHIIDFLEMEGLTAAEELGKTEISERAVKELIAELAHDVEQDEQR